ncbi:hypothetical protein GCM10011369_23430 [Neiella marina]|uniref:Lambda phage tail tube protein N-terminal domain-containing protein n=1 Tax=Neiella marina TaxID=508461 RepID=A0A8J2XPF1_9GAMM|nr:phage tail tube protein [Neiella marina]GGA80783.1 hypothetical protein GCM10011369_23430 [Neiella marina]
MLGNKVTLHRSTDQGTAYGEKIANIVDLQPGAKTAETHENTQYGASHDYKEYDYGLKDGGEYTFVVKYEAGNTDVEALADALENSTKEYLQLQFPAPISKTKSFRCLVTEVGIQTPLGEHIKQSIKVKVDGPIAEAALT